MQKENVPNISVDKILIIRTGMHGDVLLSTSCLEALRQKFPNAAIDFFVSTPYHEILADNPFVNSVLVSSKKKYLNYLFGRIRLLVRIFFSRYQLVIDFQATDISRLVVLLSRAKYRLGWEDAKFASLFYNLKAPSNRDCYSAVRNFRMLRPLGIQEQPFKMLYYIKEQSAKKVDDWLLSNNIDSQELIIFSPGAGRAYKAWNPYSFAALADVIIEKYNIKAAIIWAPKELDAALKMKNAMKKNVFLLDKTTYNEAAAFVKKAKLLICNDGGLNHVSVAVGTPSIAFFCFTNPQFWSPQGAFKNHYHIYNAEYAKDKLNMNDKNNTFGITPEEAFNKVEKIFEELGFMIKSRNSFEHNE